MLGTCISCRVPLYQQYLLPYTRIDVFRPISILSSNAARDNSVTVDSMDNKTPEQAQQSPHETSELACEGAPETFEVFQTPDVKSNPEAGKCNPLTDPHCAHDDKLPGEPGVSRIIRLTSGLSHLQALQYQLLLF